MSEKLESIKFELSPHSNDRLANLCGQFNEHLGLLEQRLGVEINHRGYHFDVIGEQGAASLAHELMQNLYALTETETLQPSKVHLHLQEASLDTILAEGDAEEVIQVKTRRGVIRARGKSQADYITNIQRRDLTFGVGPAGTGKTYLAVACAVDALESDMVRRLVLVRPAVEAGERLGFLPGDLSQKIDPYLRPMYDALYEMLGFERVNKLMERNIIEVAPLAYMRGRTLNEAFVILDEAQNTTPEQMKMFLTRTGFGSTVVVTGDVTQVDLPRGQESGLRQVVRILRDVEGVSFNFFTSRDVVRHPLVRRIVEAYESSDIES